jgi:tetratricopeptide (TPR) repeat protein
LEAKQGNLRFRSFLSAEGQKKSAPRHDGLKAEEGRPFSGLLEAGLFGDGLCGGSLIELNPKVAVFFNKRGNAYYSKKDYGSAIADYSKAIELVPSNAIYFENRADAYRLKGDYDSAIENYSEAVRLDPKDVSAYKNIGLVYEKTGNNENALACYRRALDIYEAIGNTSGAAEVKESMERLGKKE